VQVGVKLCGDDDDGNLMGSASTGHREDALHICFSLSHWWSVEERQETQISLVLVLGLARNNLGSRLRWQSAGAGAGVGILRNALLATVE
jgi:hypothetical protein